MKELSLNGRNWTVNETVRHFPGHFHIRVCFLTWSGLIIFAGYGGKLDGNLLFRLCFQQERHNTVLRQTASGKDCLLIKFVGYTPCIRSAGQGSPQRETEIALVIPQDVDELLAVSRDHRAYLHFHDFFRRGRQGPRSISS